jgi:response regulator RpfG family c-di-GMP phosphodiesterase
MSATDVSAKVLVVDDEPAITIALAKKLRRDGYDCLTAGSGEEALRRLASDDLDVVITDVRMPGMSGIDLLKEVKRRDPAVQVILMTAYTDIGFAVDALRHKADDYLLKPFNLGELSASVAQSVEQRRILHEERALLDGRPKAEAAFVERMCREAIGALAGVIESRVDVIDARMDEVARYALATGRQLGLSEKAMRDLWLGAALRDVGMLSVPESILAKPGPLSPEEWEAVHRHPQVGADLIDGVPYLAPARAAVLHHHERWGGDGYPSGLKANAISVEGCIVAVADAYSAMMSERPYRAALTEKDALAEIRRGGGTQYDRRVVEAFLSAHGQGFPTGDL